MSKQKVTIEILKEGDHKWVIRDEGDEVTLRNKVGNFLVGFTSRAQGAAEGQSFFLQYDYLSEPRTRIFNTKEVASVEVEFFDMEDMV